MATPLKTVKGENNMKKSLIAVIGLIGIVITLTAVTFFVGCGGRNEDITTYNIKVVLDAENMTAACVETAAYVNKSDAELDGVYFHLYPAAFRKDARYFSTDSKNLSTAYPKGVDYGGITIDKVTIKGEEAEWEIAGEDEDILIVKTALLPGETADIVIIFNLDIPEARHRFGYSDGILNLGNFYPIAAVYENGGWRTDPYYTNGDPFYSDIADYSVTFTAPTGWNVAGSGKIETSIDGETTTTKFTADGIRDFALSASQKFDTKETTTEKGVTVRYYFAGDPDAADHLKVAVDAVNTFSSLFGDYGKNSISVVRTPFVYGGMEYPQIVYVSDSLDGSLFEEAIIHEVAHQWWYSAVGNDQINDAWMDEGLSEYSVTLFYENNPSYEIDTEKRIADAMQGYVLFTEMYSEITGGDTSMNRNLGDYSSTMDYNYHTYVKGSLLFDSLRHAIGNDKFLEGLRSYYKEYNGKIAQPDALIAAFENASGVRLKTFFDNWVSGKVGLYQ